MSPAQLQVHIYWNQILNSTVYLHSEHTFMNEYEPVVSTNIKNACIKRCTYDSKLSHEYNHISFVT